MSLQINTAMCRKVLIMVCSLWWGMPLLAQQVKVTRHISSADGLSNDFVVGLAIDGQGYVWVATEAGVNRIAGKSCQPFPQSPLTDGQRITAVFWHAATGQMLIGSERGLTVYRPATPNDDAIVLKCSYALGRPKPTAHVVIEDCEVSGYDIGTLLDGTRSQHTEKAPDGDGPTERIKLGTESNGGFRHVTIRRCTFTHCRGLALETVDGAPMEYVSVDDIKMRDICNSPIYIRLGNRMRAPDGFRRSTASHIRISRVRVDDADSRYAILIVGTEGNRIRHVRLSDIHIRYRGGLTLDDVQQQLGSNPFFFAGTAKAGINRGNEIEGYPEPSAHGLQPAWGLSISHAENVHLKNILLETLQHDQRPAIFTHDTKRVRMRHVTTRN